MIEIGGMIKIGGLREREREREKEKLKEKVKERERDDVRRSSAPRRRNIFLFFQLIKNAGHFMEVTCSCVDNPNAGILFSSSPTSLDMTECPICLIDLTHTKLEEQEIHVNKCLDCDEAASQLSQKSWKECPLCGKPDTTVDHLKKCAKDKGVLPRDVVGIIEEFESKNGIITRKQPVKRATNKTTSTKTGKGRAPRGSKKKEAKLIEAHFNGVKEDQTSISTSSKCQYFPEEPVVLSASSSQARTVSIKKGKLTTRRELLSKEEIAEKLNHFLLNRTINNQIIETFPLPSTKNHHYFDICTKALECGQFSLPPTVFIAQNFENYIKAKKTIVRQTEKDDDECSQAGFPTDEAAVEIHAVGELVSRLTRLPCDTLIKTRDGVDVTCPSSLWSSCTNTSPQPLQSQHSSTTSALLYQVDARTFDSHVIWSFVSYCRTGRLLVQPSYIPEMMVFLEKYGFRSLLQLLQTRNR
jgi:hypothetical protein